MIQKLKRRIFPLYLVPLLLFPSLLQAAIVRLWAVNDGEKVDRDDLNNRYRTFNSIWDGKKIRLFAARNEIVAFQLIVESDATGIQRLSMRLPELTERGGLSKIEYKAPTVDPTLYQERPIQLFSVNTMKVSNASKADWVYAHNKPVVPKNPTGWKPVQLVPENASPGKGGFPLKVGPKQNQAFWVEIYTGRNRSAGIYEGRVQVFADGRTLSVPLELELLDLSLPDENSMHAMVYYSSLEPELYHGRNLDAEYHRFAHRQRVELVDAYSIVSARAALGRFSGSDFSAAKGYEGPGEGIGNQIIPASFYGPGHDYDTKENAWKKSDAWMKFLEQTLPGKITFLYMPDEPGPEEFAHIRKLAENIHSNPGPGRGLPTLVTHSYDPALDGAIDIWCSGPSGYDIQRALKERSRGHDYWVYNGGRPAGGAIVIDAPATDARSIIWACFRHGIKVYFYWHGVHWEHNTQKQGERKQNVWVNPITFDNRGQPNKPINDQGAINGDGVLMYPGEEKLHPEEDRGIAGPCSTIQLANFRRGLQDHQYLTLARQLGLHSLVDEVLKTVVPRVFSDAGDTVGFAEDGDAYENARNKLAKAIVKAKALK